MSRIEEIETRLEKITPGPWTYLEIPAQEEWESAKGFVGAVPYEGHPFKGHTRYFDVLGDEEYPTKKGDMLFIAAAPDDIQYLLGSLKTAEQQRDEARELLVAGVVVQVKIVGTAIGQSHYKESWIVSTSCSSPPPGADAQEGR